MIRIKRDKDEPPALIRVRARQLKRAVQAYNKHGPASEEFRNTLTGYNAHAIKEKLFLAQHRKCAWCERNRDFSSSPVEHYRPKKGSRRHLPGEKPEVRDPEHYWWLAWTWTNLFFSCTRCNDQGHKANYFPLVKGTKPLSALKKPIPSSLPSTIFDTSSEQPLLLDPSTLDPWKHIQWIPEFTHLKREQWVWSPAGITARGKATIRILKLHELGDFVQNHLNKCVLPSIEEIEKHVRATPKRVNDARARWDKLLGDTLAPESELSAATWCALEIWMPKAKRVASSLAEPRRPGS